MIETVHLVGVLLSLGAAFAGASQNLFIRIGTDEGNAYDAVLVVMLLNVVLLLPPVLVIYYPDYGLTRQSWISFIAAGVLGTLLGRMCTYSSIDRIGASRTAPIVASWALISSVLGVIVLGETLTPLHGFGIVLIVAGVAVIAWETSQENPDDLPRRELLIGLLIPVLGAFAFGVEPIFANVGFAEGTPAPVGLVVKTIFATGGFALYLRWRNALPDRATLLSRNSRWFFLAGIASTCFLLGYYVGLSLAPVNVVVPIIVTNTLFVVVLSALFMPQRLERVTARLLAAAAVVVVGVLVITLSG